MADWRVVTRSKRIGASQKIGEFRERASAEFDVLIGARSRRVVETGAGYQRRRRRCFDAFGECYEKC
jgi:hypothetical protein